MRETGLLSLSLLFTDEQTRDQKRLVPVPNSQKSGAEPGGTSDSKCRVFSFWNTTAYSAILCSAPIAYALCWVCCPDTYSRGRSSSHWGLSQVEERQSRNSQFLRKTEVFNWGTKSVTQSISEHLPGARSGDTKWRDSPCPGGTPCDHRNQTNQNTANHSFPCLTRDQVCAGALPMTL